MLVHTDSLSVFSFLFLFSFSFLFFLRVFFSDSSISCLALDVFFLVFYLFFSLDFSYYRTLRLSPPFIYLNLGLCTQ